MKKLAKNLFTALAACVLIGSFASCSDFIDEDPFSIASEISSQRGNSSSISTDTGGGITTDMTIWSGEAELDWNKGDNNGDCISKDKFAEKTFTGLKFTISKFVKDNATIKILQQEVWKDISFKSADGDGKLADSGEDSGKALWVWGNSVTVTFSEETVKAIKENGIKFYGTGVTITKVELAE